MSYEYSGYLATLLDAPDPDIRDSLEYIEFSTDDLSQWALIDNEADKEWQHIPAASERTDTGLVLRGHFEDVRRIDFLDPADPSFWVALSSLRSEDPRFPIDLIRYPIIETSYRSLTSRAHPAWVWHYPGGMHLDGLIPVREWRTVARLVPHFGFPSQVNRMTFRLYSASRSTEAMEIQSLRFRAASPAERNAIDQRGAELASSRAPHYPVLDDFLPVGVCMKAGTAKTMAETMEISLHDYWRLALEDITRHSHNCIALEEVDKLDTGEWRDLLDIAQRFRVRLVAMFDWPMDRFDVQGDELISRYIQPYAGSEAILAWSVQNEPPEHSFAVHLDARNRIAKADPNHPMAVMMHDPDAFPLYAPFFAASGMTYFRSKAAWQLGDLIRTHYSLSRGQQFWIQTPAFVYGTDTPEWNTCPEMRLMLNQAFANGASGWFAFAYHNTPIWMGGQCQRSLTGPFLTFSDLWSELGQRIERLSALLPLLNGAVPDGSHEEGFDITCRPNPRTQLPPEIPSIQWGWLHGNDYTLLYMVNNDIGEVTPVNIAIPENLPRGMEVYDLTDFTRSRSWAPMDRQRHIEMFPGQGQLFLIAEREICEYWRDIIARGVAASDIRHINIDLDLAQHYDLDTSEAMRLIRQAEAGEAIECLLAMRMARDALTDLIYSAPKLYAPRSNLIQASAAICGCDGSLCRLLGMGRVDEAHELGRKVIPLTREMTSLRLQLRNGRGTEIEAACDDLKARTLAHLGEIRSHF